jgi:phosphomannomutase
MITASHNPKQDNGYKVYWNNGCQIIPPHDSNISNEILNNLEPWSWDYKAVEQCIDPFDQVAGEYFNSITRLCPVLQAPTVVVPRSLFCYTPMHGVGQLFAERAFAEAGLNPFVSVQEQMKPGFLCGLFCRSRVSHC